MYYSLLRVKPYITGKVEDDEFVFPRRQLLEVDSEVWIYFRYKTYMIQPSNWDLYADKIDMVMKESCSKYKQIQ